ncbi:hypothetical protein [Enterobacter hormaechei]
MTRFRQMLYIIVTGLVTAGVLTGYYCGTELTFSLFHARLIWYSTIRMRR